MKRPIYIILTAMALLVALCSCDDDTFTISPSNQLTFSIDTVRFDTLFSTVPSSTRSFWVYNRSGDGLRCTNVRLANGNQTGFRVNVDGAFLSPTAGYQVNDIEVRNKDSIRVFVELTSPRNHQDVPTKLKDDLIFTLESGVQQRVNLEAYSWDARLMQDVSIDEDSTLSGSTPIVVYGGIKVSEGATLTIAAGTTIYFHAGAGIEVHGRLVCQGTATENVVLRGDRLDRMFDYLPYDFVSGQWNGIRLCGESYDNSIRFTDIHGAFDGLVADSSDVERQKLLLECSTIHNCQGYGLKTVNSQIQLSNCQITNTLHNCVAVYGGRMDMNNCTLAQFYPFDASRGNALLFSSLEHPLHQLDCRNTLITGYADDEMTGTHDKDSENAFNFLFSNCIIRTPKVETDDSVRFVNVSFELPEDTVGTGKRHFRKVDIDSQRYDFHTDSLSTAIGKADPETAATTDRDGQQRDGKPDIGAYEFLEEQEKGDEENPND
ncbi:MAG: right-handed parallel beta-helix repeat-containing protein [Prevotella sp.]